MNRAVQMALSVLGLAVAATPAVVYVQPTAGVARNAISLFAIVVVAGLLLMALGRTRPTAISFATALGFAVLTPLASEHAPWATGSAVDVYAVQRDVNTLMPALLFGGVGALMLPRRRPVARMVTVLAGAGIAATIVGAPGDLRLLALPFWWHVPAGLRTIRRMLSAPRADLFVRAIAVTTSLVVIGYLWSPVRAWMSGVGLVLAPLLADGRPAG